jgi:hypothetical protein
MKTLYKKASHLRSHTWKDIGGLGGLLLDFAFFAFLLIVSALVLSVGAIVIALDYLLAPVLSLTSLRKSSQIKNRDESVLLEDGTLGNRPLAPMESSKA